MNATQTDAAVLRAFREPIEVEEVTLREPGRGEALVRMVAAGVCHSDVGQADGEWEFPLPTVLGHEGAAVVEALGPDVDGIEPGARVVLSLAPGCGACLHCRAGFPIRCQGSLDAMTEGRLTTGPATLSDGHGSIATYSLLSCFARHAVVAAESLVPLPDDVPAEVAALIGCAVITGAGAAFETLEIAAGSRGAVIGVGGVGASALQGALARGAVEVTAIDPTPDRRERALALGATAAIDPTDEGAAGSLVASAARDGFDWTIVTVGSPSAMRLGVDLTRPGGETAIVGLAPQGEPAHIDMLDVVTYEKTIKGSAYGSRSPQELIPRIISMYRHGALRLDDLVSEILPLERINEAFDLSRRAAGMRPVLALTSGGAF